MFDRLLQYHRVYSAFTRNAFLTMLAYRMRYFTGVLTYSLYVSVNFFIWEAVFANLEPGAAIKGFSLEQMVTYITVGWIARTAYFSDIDFEIDELVRTGEISLYLIRPVNFQLLMLSKAIGQTLYRLLLFTLPFGLVISLVFPIQPPASTFGLVMFFVSTASGFLILVSLNFAVGLLAFTFKSIMGFIRAKYFIVQLCSGLLLPLAFFPEWFRLILEVLPFKAVAYVPLQFYLGNYGVEDLPPVLLHQLIWIVVMILIGKVAWMRAISRLTVQGG